MPAAARKSADAAPVVDGSGAPTPVADSSAPVAGEAPPAGPAEVAPVEAPRPPVTLVFNGQAESAVAGVGLCVPGESYTVPAAVADEVCRGDHPQFARLVAA